MGSMLSRRKVPHSPARQARDMPRSGSMSPQAVTEVKKARRETGDQGLFIAWTCFVNVMPYLDTASMHNMRLVSKSHRQAVDGYLLVEKGRVPLYPPLGFKTAKYLKAYDIYVLARYGEEAWKAGWRDNHSREFIKLSRQVRRDLQTICDAFNQRNMVDLDVEQLSPMPDNFTSGRPRHVTAIDVYVIRKYGVKYWEGKNQAHQIYFGQLEDEYNHLCQRAKYHLQLEARVVNQRYTISEFTAPPLPPTFEPGRHVDNFDVFVIRKYGMKEWQSSCSSVGSHINITYREEFRRLSSSIRDSLRLEAKTINCRLPPTPMPPPLPAAFKTDKQLGSLDVYVIRKLGEQAWRSRYHNWAAERSEYCLLSDGNRWSLKKEADELNRSIELTARDLASMHGITNEGAVYSLDPSKRRRSAS